MEEEEVARDQAVDQGETSDRQRQTDWEQSQLIFLLNSCKEFDDGFPGKICDSL